MLVFIWSHTRVVVTVLVQICLLQTNTRVNESWNLHWKLWSLIWKWNYSIWNKFILASEYSLRLLVELNITNTKPSCLFVRLVTKKNMRTTKHKLAYRLVVCLVVLMFYFRDLSDKQAFGFSVCYYRLYSEAKMNLFQIE